MPLERTRGNPADPARRARPRPEGQGARRNPTPGLSPTCPGVSQLRSAKGDPSGPPPSGGGENSPGWAPSRRSEKAAGGERPYCAPGGRRGRSLPARPPARPPPAPPPPSVPLGRGRAGRPHSEPEPEPARSRRPGRSVSLRDTGAGRHAAAATGQSPGPPRLSGRRAAGRGDAEGGGAPRSRDPGSRDAGLWAEATPPKARAESGETG